MPKKRTGNPYFKFKQFTVYQHNVGLRVTTDACIFGAWVNTSGFKNILDVGTGTGLLTLMNAQNNREAHYTAIDINEQAYLQATENFALSPWSNRIRCLHTSVQDFIKNTQEKFDAIICNPPFFHNHLLGLSTAANHAKHGLELSINDLINAIKILLTPNGTAFLLLPYCTENIWLEPIRYKDLWVAESTYISNFQNHAPIRVMLKITHFADTNLVPFVQRFVIFKNTKTYTAQFNQLLKNYYLYIN